MRLLLLVTLLGLLVGCTAFQSLNVQRAGLRSAGDTGATLYLETRDSGVDEHRKNLTTYADVLLAWLEKADAKPTLKLLTMEVKEVVPVPYSGLLSADLLAAMVPEEVKADGILGTANLKRLIAFLRGVKSGATYYEKAAVEEPVSGGEGG